MRANSEELSSRTVDASYFSGMRRRGEDSASRALTKEEEEEGTRPSLFLSNK